MSRDSSTRGSLDKARFRTVLTRTRPIPTPTATGTNSDCGQFYHVKTGDDCSTIGEQFGISLSDFRFLNPEIWANCTNLLADTYYCVEPVGYISTYPGYGATTTTSPFNKTAATALPNVGNILANYTNTQPVILIANSTRLDCYEYIFFDNVTDNAAADCWALSMIYDITGEEFILWNPSLANTNEVLTESARISATASAIAAAAMTSTTATTTGNAYAYPCTLSANTSYCVALMSPTAAPAATLAPPSPRAAGEVANCTTWYAPRSYDTCTGILGVFHLTIGQFYAMNPSVGADCRSMALGTYYCISWYPGGTPPGEPYSDIVKSGTSTSSRTSTSSNTGSSSKTSTSSTTGSSSTTGIVTPSPVQPGMTANCNKFYDVHSGDGCSAIAQSYSVALSSFYSWNPAVSTDCSGLQASVYVCVGVKTTAAATTTTTRTTGTTTSTATGVVTPSPIQPGMVSHCDKFYDVHSGDGCYAIAQSYSIALSNFYSWNPAVSTDCSGLQASVYVCVAVEAAATTTTPTRTSSATGVATPTPTQSGMVTGCRKFYYVVAGDGCYNIAAAQGIALSNFYAWNPAVKTDCSGLQTGYYVCVGIV